MNKQTLTAFWPPRRLMLLALFLHLISLPLAYTTGGVLTSETKEAYGIIRTEFTYTATLFGGINPQNGIQVAPHSLVVLPVLLYVFTVLEPKRGFWRRRSGYVLCLFLLLCCGGTMETFGGRLALFALAVGAVAVVSRFAAPEPAPPVMYASGG